jgi:pyruvate,orthophosphate dikinase
MTLFAPVTRYVYAFDEPSEGGRDLLGGKGIGLAEMTQLGVPVPAGFTITTDACRAYMREGGLPAGLDEEIGEHIARLEEQAGKRFGDDSDPLLVSVRSGAAVSMPGMMDTILNVGLNDVAVQGLARSTGNDEFAQDCYRRLIQMYGETVDGISHDRFRPDDDVAHAREIYSTETGDEFPQDAREQ